MRFDLMGYDQETGPTPGFLWATRQSGHLSIATTGTAVAKRYLFKITTKKTDKKDWPPANPIYYVAERKVDAEKWANAYILPGLYVYKIKRLAEQVAKRVFWD